MQLYEAADYTGTGAAVSLASILGIAAGAASRAKYFQVTGISIGATAARIGGPSVSATRGIPISSSGGFFGAPIAQAVDFYNLQTIYVLVQVGDSVSVSYAI